MQHETRIRQQRAFGEIALFWIQHQRLIQPSWCKGDKPVLDGPLDQKASYEQWIESLHPDDRDRIVAQLDELFNQKLHNWSMEYRIRTATGRTRWIDSRGQVFYDVAGKPKRMVGINVDITSRRFATDLAPELQTRLRTGS